jgi:hypothetical protein
MDNINWRLLIVIYILLAGVWGTLVKVASDRLNPLTMSFVVSTSGVVGCNGSCPARIELSKDNRCVAGCGLRFDGWFSGCYLLQCPQAGAGIVLGLVSIYLLTS